MQHLIKCQTLFVSTSYNLNNFQVYQYMKNDQHNFSYLNQMRQTPRKKNHPPFFCFLQYCFIVFPRSERSDRSEAIVESATRRPTQGHYYFSNYVFKSSDLCQKKRDSGARLEQTQILVLLTVDINYRYPFTPQAASNMKKKHSEVNLSEPQFRSIGCIKTCTFLSQGNTKQKLRNICSQTSAIDLNWGQVELKTL